MAFVWYAMVLFCGADATFPRPLPPLELVNPIRQPPPSPAEHLHFEDAFAAVQARGSGPPAQEALPPPNPVFGDVSVVAACGNRTESLRNAFPTWLRTGARDIVVVDWASEPPLMDALDLRHAGVSVVRVADQFKWVLSWAYNVAMAHAKHAKVLKVDCDTLLEPDFFGAHPLQPGTFYAGDWQEARTSEELHLNGVLYVHAADFWAVNGFDERIQTYGWDDSDIRQRLENLGLRAGRLQLDTLHHHPHATSLRDTLHHNRLHLPPQLMTQRNRFLLDTVPAWSPAFRSNAMVVTSEAPGTLSCTSSAIGCSCFSGEPRIALWEKAQLSIQSALLLLILHFFRAQQSYQRSN